MKGNREKDYLTTNELAKILGLSHVAVYKKIIKGRIKAVRIGRNYIIPKKELGMLFGPVLSGSTKVTIREAVKKTMKDYGETLRLLGQE